MQKNLVLINSTSPYADLNHFLPVNLLNLANYLHAHDPRIRIEIIDTQFDQIAGPVRDLIANVDAIGITCGYGLAYLPTLAIARKCRKINPNAPIIVGGHQVNVVPEDFLNFDKLFDYVATGWGETALGIILDQLFLHNFSRPEHPHLVSGEPVSPGDFIGMPDWTLLSKYMKRTDIFPQLILQFARGCPASCKFCVNSGNARYALRSVSPQVALEQVRIALDFIVKEGVHDPGKYLMIPNTFNVGDENFGGANREWQQKFMTGLIERRATFPIEDFGFFVHHRIDTLAQDDIPLFDQARVNLTFGLESFSPKILTAMGKAPDPAQYLKHARDTLVRPKYSHPHTYYDFNLLVNFPSETQETLNEDIQMLEILAKNSSDLVFPVARPFYLLPGNKLYEQMTEYELKYGSHFFFPHWWREDFASVKQFISNPSHSTSFFDVYNWLAKDYYQSAIHILEHDLAISPHIVFQQRYNDLKKMPPVIEGLLSVAHQLIEQREKKLASNRPVLSQSVGVD